MYEHLWYAKGKRRDESVRLLSPVPLGEPCTDFYRAHSKGPWGKTTPLPRVRAFRSTMPCQRDLERARFLR